MQKTVRNVDEDIFERAKKLAKEKDIRIGDVVNEALLAWISQEKEPESNIMDFEPVESDLESNLSENYEKEIYG